MAYSAPSAAPPPTTARPRRPASSAEIDEITHFLSRYAPSGRERADRPPDLADSLASLLRAPEAARLLAALPTGPDCLIEGCAGPGNAAALRSALGGVGVPRPRLLAVDLLDLPQAYQRCGYEWPDMRFVRADACDLRLLAANASFDLVVQDFLLNCIPPAHAPRLLTEAARVLRPGGLALISFTDDLGARARLPLAAAEIAARHGLLWDSAAGQLSDLEPDPTLRARLLRELAGTVVETSDPTAFTLITAPYGRFEYFVSASRTRDLLGDAGLELLVERIDQGRDDHGLDCVRHRCLARRVES